MTYKFRCSDSVEPFKEKIRKTWRLEERQKGDYKSPTIFFGLFHLNDWLSFMRHRGKRIAWWAGSDIKLLQRGYAFSDGDGLRWSKLLRWLPWHWIFRWFKAEHYAENEVEGQALLDLGIEGIYVKPSFLENIDDFPVSFKPPIWREAPRVFLSTNIGREKEYGFDLVKRLAERLPDIEFHLYGSTSREYSRMTLKYHNLIFHGRVSPGQFNEEIKNYHCGLRTNEFDGFSEIIAKSVLMGQFPISRIKYPHIWHYETEEELVRQLKRLKTIGAPNVSARAFWRNNVNNYPWICQHTEK